MLRGLDASSVQGPLPFKALGPDYHFAILKAQQGNDGFDPWFAKNARAGLDTGLEVFAYCFAYPLPAAQGKANRCPKEQAKLFVDRTFKACLELEGRPIFLDYEWPAPQDWAHWGCSASQINDWLQDNAATVESLSGAKPVIYTYLWWWDALSKGSDTSWAAAYDLWMAWYVKSWPSPGQSPKLPAPWKTWRFWQWDGDGGLRLPNGCDADFCVFNGDEDALKAFARGPS